MNRLAAQVWFLVSALILSPAAQAQDADLAKKLANPIASLISVPFQFNYDEGLGPSQTGSRTVLNIQPVIPISLNSNWNVISRTIVPLVSFSDLTPGLGTETGTGDVLQSFFFSPKEPTEGGLVWGGGPAFGLPTASDSSLGTGKWLLGPTAVALRVQGPWTYGMLANHLWSVGGSSSRNGVNQTFVQPFASYTTPDAWTFGASSEAAFNWHGDEWSIPVNLTVSKLVTFNKQPVSLQVGVRYWADPATNGPRDFGARLAVTYLFPK